MLKLAFYGDDFTGSTDVMEALSLAGVRTVLFLQAPTPAQIAGFGDLEAFGIAGSSRNMTPDAMDAHLPAIFESLKASGAPVVHYKVCSTFDSSPEIGSIGRAIDLGQSAFRSPCVPLLAAAPVLGRYCAFGNLFARSGLDTEPFRLDRHPTMSRHPVTPMSESDLRLHLSKQTSMPSALFDLLRLECPDPETELANLLRLEPQILVFDAVYPRHLDIIGRLIWNAAAQSPPLFMAGSSGIEYALAAHWRSIGLTPPESPRFQAEPAGELLVVSGSCSPVTALQIEHACASGFAELPVRPEYLVDPVTARNEIGRTVDAALGILRGQNRLILHTCKGPDDPRRAATAERLSQLGLSPAEARTETAPRLGAALGFILELILEKRPVRRVAVTGGDTSTFVARQLDIEALEMIAPMAPGSPLCRIHAPDRFMHHHEILFKGGQVGRTDFFQMLL